MTRSAHQPDLVPSRRRACAGALLAELLTGEAASHDTRLGINRIARATPGVIGLNQAMTMHFGPNDVFVALSLDFEDTLSASDVERTVTSIERRIKDRHPDVTRVFIEAQSFDADRRAGRG